MTTTNQNLKYYEGRPVLNKSDIPERYRPLTNFYRDSERDWLNSVIRDMRGIDYILVQTVYGIEVWRSGMKSVDELKRERFGNE